VTALDQSQASDIDPAFFYYLHRSAIKYTKKPKQVTSHVFAETTYVVTAPCGFASVVIPPTKSYIPSFIEIRSGVSESWGSKFAHSLTLAIGFYNSLHCRASHEYYRKRKMP